VRPLRRDVLRPGLGPDAVRWPGDDEPATLHAGVLAADGRVLSVGTIVRARLPERAAEAWRVRGMATLPAERGRGLGRAVLAALVAHAEASGDGPVWCHARPAAVSLYERAGFRRAGEPYEHEGLGPHVLLVRAGAP
jgi:GNAT superfamily N-acetyltransferase